MNEDLLKGALRQLDALRATLVVALAKAEQVNHAKPAVPTKHENGRLTDHGVMELRSMIDAGFQDSEIARALEITQPAVYNQRQKYLAETPRRRKAGR